MPPTLEDQLLADESYDGHPNIKLEPQSPKATPHAISKNNAAPSPIFVSSIPRKPVLDPLEPLRALPEVREIPWHPGRELEPEKSVYSSRSQTRSAFLLATRGVVRDPPCTHCASGIVGRFSLCVTLDDWFHGACATCQMGTRAHTCSLRTQREAQIDGKDKKKKKQSSGGVPSAQPEQLQQQTPNPSQPPIEQSEGPRSSLKRKRPSPQAPPASISRPRLSYSPARATSSPRYSQTPDYTAPPSYATPPAYATPQTLVHTDKSALLQYVYEEQNDPSGNKLKRHHQQYLAEIESQSAGGQTPSVPSYNRGTPAPTTVDVSAERRASPGYFADGTRASSGMKVIRNTEGRHENYGQIPIDIIVANRPAWSSINRPCDERQTPSGHRGSEGQAGPVDNRYDGTRNPSLTNGTVSGQPSTPVTPYDATIPSSGTPNPQARPPATQYTNGVIQTPNGTNQSSRLSPMTHAVPILQSQPQAKSQPNSSPQNHQLSNLPTKSPDPLLFDMLPRKKQKQILTIIGGLQSGIRGAQQQAESMQQQLNVLEELLGVGGEDNERSVVWK